MDEMEDSNFTENTQGQSSFIILPSQEESQQESQPDKQMIKIIKNLPALQNPDKAVLSSDTCTDEEHEKGKTSVLVSDTDSVAKTDGNVGPSDCVSESDSDEEVTIIQKKLSGERTGGKSENHSSSDGSSPGNMSSFQSRNRSNLGSYDQCEVYKTQKGHAKGDRFDSFPASQDMFAETVEQDSPSTPSEHLGSLQFSQKPMLVPETVEETLNEIPPSPGVYGSTPIIIPNSPTQETGNQSFLLETGDQDKEEAGSQHKESSDEGNQTVFDINAAETLASQPQVDSFLEAAKESSLKEYQTSQGKDKSLEEDVRQKDNLSSESVQLNFSQGTLNVPDKGSSRKVLRVRSVQQERGGLRPLISSQKLQAPENSKSEREVIIIPSGSASINSQKEVEGSDNLMLRLTQSECTMENSQSQKNKVSGSRSQMVEHKKPGSQESRSQDKGQREGSQSSRSRHQSSGSGSGSQKKKKSTRDKHIEHLNDNPLIEWKNESDTERKQEMSVKSSNRFSDEFHLDVPVVMSSKEPEVAMVTDKPSLAIETEKPVSQVIASNTQPQAAQKTEKLVHSEDLVPMSTGEPDKLSIGMIQSQSEQTEPVFKLQKPQIEELNILDESEDVFPRRTGKPKGHSRYILEDSDEEFCDHPTTGDTVKLTKTTDSCTGMEKDEPLVATKLDMYMGHDDGNEDTQSYQANIDLQTDVNGNNEQKQSKTHDTGSVVSGNNQGSSRMRRLTESSTQTADSKVDNFENVDINVVQKVADYLQSGLHSRSRSNSTCTDLSDFHGDGSEKGDNVMKTPQRKDRLDKIKTPTSLSRRESADQRSPKSPSEIQTIIRTYSDILKKQKHKPKKDDKLLPSSQKPNPIASEETGKVSLVPRRLSSQSLPEDLIRGKQGSRTPNSSAFDPWMTARKPQSQLTVESDTKSDKISDMNSQRDNSNHSETGVTQDLSKSFKPHKEIDNVSHYSEPIVISQDSDVIMETELALAKSEKRNNRSDLTKKSSLKLNLNKEEKKSDEQCSDIREKSASEMLYLTPDTRKNGSTKNSPPFLTLERVDSPKKISEKSNLLCIDIPVGTENKDFMHNEDNNMSKLGNQNVLSLKPKDTLIIKGAVNEQSDSHETSETRKNTRKLDQNPSTSVATLQRDDTKVLRETRQSKKPYYARSLRNKRKVKRRLSAEKRNISRRRTSSLSPTLLSGGSPPLVSSRVSQQTISDTFVASTQKFSPSNNNKDDIYGFHGSESQPSPEKVIIQAITPGKTPLSSRKRTRTQHKKSGLKKQRHEIDDTETSSENKHHVTFETSHRISSQGSDTTVTTIGSLQSIPSSISQSSPKRDTIVSPSSSSSSKQSVSEGTTTRMSGKRMSIDQALPDTLPLTHSEEDNYQKVTVVIEKVERVYREITTTRKVIGAQGQVLENTQDVKRLDPVIVEENTHKKIQYVYIPSPSRSVTSMTSGDLADVSSSLSRSSVSSGSLGSKVGSLSSSLENRLPGVGKHLETQTSLDQSHPDHIHLEAKSSESLEAVSEKSHTSEVMAAPSSVPRPRYPRSVSADKSSDKPSSAGKIRRQYSLTTENQSNLAGTQHNTPDIQNTRQQTSGTSHEPVNQPKPETPVVHSDQEVSDVQTPLGSTINKTSSYLHSRTSSVESPKASDSLFSTSSDDNKKSTSNLHNIRSQKKIDEDSSTDNSTKQSNSSDHVSSEIPDQEQLVSSSSTPEESVAIVTSNGKIGSRVMGKWKDGFFYPGTLKSTADRYTKYSVHFDDGSKLSVKAADILLVERLPLGQSVMVATDDGDFVSGLITKIEGDVYIVETDEGTSGRYTFGEVILSGDQAACVISDHGNDVLLQHQPPTGLPANVGDVSLENLLDAPRRSAKKGSATEVKIEEEGQGQSGRGRKRKLDTLQPQATSTPTPKGKMESKISKRRKLLSDSPISGIQSSPVTVGKSLRKTRVGLFGRDLGPVPTKKIFKNIHFLLTNVEKTKEQSEQEKKLIQNTSLDTSTDESTAEEEASVPFDKEHLKQQIEAGGGTVLESLDENLISKGKRKIILLSSTYQRTIKYLQCLAGGVPCLSHMWVIDSCSQDNLLDDKSYVLPAGISLEKRKIMEWRKKNNVFQGIKAVVYSKNNKFVESWTQILSLSKCHVHKQVQYSDVHVIVTDNTCTPAIQRAAENTSIPLVGTEWVIQCIVNGRLMSYTGHSRYNHDCWS